MTSRIVEVYTHTHTQPPCAESLSATAREDSAVVPGNYALTCTSRPGYCTSGTYLREMKTHVQRKPTQVFSAALFLTEPTQMSFTEQVVTQQQLVYTADNTWQ